MYTISSDIVVQVAGYFSQSGGIEVWGSLNLSDPGKQWITPLGGSKPHWGATSQPVQTITDPNEVQVVDYKEVDRFRVSLRRSSNGLSLKLTDASSRKLRERLAKADSKVDPEWGVGAQYWFDGFAQQAVIMVPAASRSLATYLPTKQGA